MMGLTLGLSGSTPTRTFFHYGYADQARSFQKGLKIGGFATDMPGLNGRQAQELLALPVHRVNDAPPNAVYIITVPATTPVIGPSLVQSQNFTGHGMSVERPGGGTEYQFPKGTHPGSVSKPIPIPEC